MILSLFSLYSRLLGPDLIMLLSLFFLFSAGPTKTCSIVHGIIMCCLQVLIGRVDDGNCVLVLLYGFYMS